MLAANADIERLRALRAIKAALLDLKWLRAATRFELAVCRHALALKAGYRPDQPRVPKGEDGAGQWVDEGGSGSPGSNPNSDPPTEPEDRPPTSRARTAILKEVARRVLQTRDEAAAIA